jgi:hypothetical protein
MSNRVDLMANLAFSPASAQLGWPRDTPLRATPEGAAKTDAQLPLDEYFNSLFTGLFLAVKRKWCRKQVAECEECPLGRYLEEGR